MENYCYLLLHRNFQYSDMIHYVKDIFLKNPEESYRKLEYLQALLMILDLNYSFFSKE